MLDKLRVNRIAAEAADIAPPLEQFFKLGPEVLVENGIWHQGYAATTAMSYTTACCKSQLQKNPIMQICSFIPAATEILYALGLEDSVAGVTFECDYPPEARQKPVVLDTVLEHSLSPAEVDRTVHEFSSHGESLYRVHTELLRQIRPDLIVTQELCDVCAVGASHVAKALHELPSAPKILSLTPHTLENVWRDIKAVGHTTGKQQEATSLVAGLRKRVEQVKQYSYAQRPRVLSLEWLSPPFNGGHWRSEE